MKSFHSGIQPLKKIEEAEVEESQTSIIPPHLDSKIIQEKSQYYNIDDFDSINHSLPSHSILPRNTKKQPVQSSIGFQCPSEPSMKKSSKSQKVSMSPESRKEEKSFIDKSISQIVESKSSNHDIFNQKLNETEQNILREISGLNDEDENMKNLLKL